MIKEILIPVDGSPSSEQAAQVGLELARRLQASVTFTNVVDQGTSFTPDEHHRSKRVIGNALVELWANKAKTLGLHAMPNLATGPNTAKAICQVAEYEAADLIVMGTHGREGLARAIWGSVAEQVAHETPVPVMFVRHTERPITPSFKRILVPIDADQIRHTVIAHAIELAQRLQAKLEFLHVTVDPAVVFGELDLEPVYNERMRSETRQIMRKALDQIGTAPLEPEQVELSELRAGFEAVHRTILRHAKRTETDLIVMGTNARTGVMKFLVGSVAEAVIHHAEIPVLLIRALEVEQEKPERVQSATVHANLGSAMSSKTQG
jgi:nucleotide-binding universal stress UspA family protein